MPVESVREARSEKMRNSLKAHLCQTDRRGEHEPSNAFGVCGREAQRDAAAERVADQIGALDAKGVQSAAHVTEQCRRRICFGAKGLIRETMAAEIAR